MRPFSMFEPTEVPATSLRKNQSSDDLVRDAQVRGNGNTVLTSRKEINLVITSRITPGFDASGGHVQAKTNGS